MKYDHPKNAVDQVALVVDLDRTLTHADIAMESLLNVARRGWRELLTIIWITFSGRAALKAWLADVDPVNPAKLPYRQEVLDLIGTARNNGQPIILASAADERNVKLVAEHLDVFDHVVGSETGHNLKSTAKLRRIREICDDGCFDYVGDSISDRPIWKSARRAYTVGAHTRCIHEERLCVSKPNLMRGLLKAARPHQWSKNILVFVPLASSGLLLHLDALARSVIAFVCLSLVAASVYLLNDAVDIDADRKHARKRHRPLASGIVSIPSALAVSAGGAVIGLMASWLLLGPQALFAIGFYFLLTVAYSFRLKSAMIVDVIALGLLYTMRIIVGAAAISVPVSFWLLLFSVFFFLSLGYLKRYIELRDSNVDEKQLVSGRGYIPLDGNLVAVSGIAAGMVSMLVILLFAEEMSHTEDYAQPALLWLLFMPLLYWLNRIWMMAHRGQVDGDPIAFAIRDRRSFIVALSLVALLIAAKFSIALPGIS